MIPMVVVGIQLDLKTQVVPTPTPPSAELSRQWSKNISSSHTHRQKRSPLLLLRDQRAKAVKEPRTELFQGLLVLSVGQNTWPPVR